MKWSQCYTSLADQRVSLPRFGHSAVAVSSSTAEYAKLASDLVVVYGGVGLQAGESAQTALSDVVVLQVDSGTWFAPDILAGSSPGARAFHSAVAVGSRVLVFGGHILTFDQEQNKKRRHFFNDIWQLDTVAWQWSLVPVDNSSGPSPPGRDMACLLQLTDSQLQLFGGRSETGKALQDSWMFDINTCTWQQLKPEGPLPPPRKMHSMVKLGSNQVVLFGGERDSGPLDDLWVFRGWVPGSMEPLRWTQIKMKVSPAPRFGHAMVAVAPAAANNGQPDKVEAATSSIAAMPSSDDTPTADTAAISSNRSEGGTSEGGVSVSTSIAAAAAASGERVVLFGGCLDLSSFISLARNYVQSKETWLLDLNMLTWLPVSTAAAGVGDDAPGERMCHSLTPLPDGRLLLLGGRHKEGICRDLWWLDVSADASASSRSSASGLSTPPQVQAAAATQPSPARPASLLQSLLGPIRPREQPQAQQAAAVPPPSPTPPAAPAAVVAAQPSSLAHQQQELDLPHTPPEPSAEGMQQGSVTPQQQQQQQAVPSNTQLIPSPPPAAAGAGAAAHLSSTHALQPGAPPPSPPLQPGLPPIPAAPAGAAGPSSNSSSSNQPLSSLIDVGGGEFAKLIKNPAAYSAGALNKLSSSVSSTMSSLLAQGQQGPLAGALPAALSRVTPSFLGSSPSSSNSSSLRVNSSDGNQQPGLAALRMQLGLKPITAATAAAGPAMTPGAVLQQLAALGQQLLGDGDSSSSSLPPDVLVSAARQHLMSSAVMQLQVPQVALLLADYQHLAADHLEKQMMSRLSRGFPAAASQGAGCSFMHRQPQDIQIGQVQQLQVEYRQLLVETT